MKSPRPKGEEWVVAEKATISLLDSRFIAVVKNEKIREDGRIETERSIGVF